MKSNLQIFAGQIAENILSCGNILQGTSRPRRTSERVLRSKAPPALSLNLPCMPVHDSAFRFFALDSSLRSE